MRVSSTSGCVHPSRDDSIMPKVSAVRLNVATEAPSQSMRPWRLLRLSGTCHKLTAMTASASGRLMKKTQRHDRCSISQPPRTGPSAVVIAVAPDQVPMALPRSLSSKHALMSARLSGTRNAAPIPCTALAAMRCPMLGAKPQ